MNSINKGNNRIYFLNNIFKYKLLVILITFVLIFTLIFNIFSPLYSYSQENNFAKGNYSRASMDIDGNIYMKENLYKKIYPASLTKIAIAIITIEKLDLNEEIYIRKTDMKVPFDYVVTPLHIGERLTVKDLLHATMLKSANDAPIQLAKYIYGTQENFKKEINKYLKNIGLKNTNFTNPFGLDNKNHYTTPYDLLTLTRYAMKNNTFRKIVRTKSYTIPSNNYSGQRILRTTSLFADSNSLVFNKNFYGVKTGTTDKAGDCFISAAKINNKEFYFIYTGAKSRISKFQKVQEMYNETKYILKQKENIDNFAKTTTEKKTLRKTSLEYLYSQFFFTIFDKIILILFFILLLILLFKIKNSNKRKR